MVVGVGHNHPVAVGDGNVVGMLQLAGLVAHRPEFGYKRAVALEYLDAVVVAVRNDELADSVDGDAGQAIEFTFAVAVAAQPEAQLTALVEDLDSMVGGVSHHNRVIQSN